MQQLVRCGDGISAASYGLELDRKDAGSQSRGKREDEGDVVGGVALGEVVPGQSDERKLR
jgi:hypothetical protein